MKECPVCSKSLIRGVCGYCLRGSEKIKKLKNKTSKVYNVNGKNILVGKKLKEKIGDISDYF